MGGVTRVMMMVIYEDRYTYSEDQEIMLMMMTSVGADSDF